MNNRNNHLPVNWIDGMKISKNHFLQSDNHFHESIITSRNIFINDYNFGLINYEESTNGSFILLFEGGKESVEITLKTCLAITRGGAYININNQNQIKLHFSPFLDNQKDNLNEWDLLISVNPFHRVPVGSPDINENPPRHPFTEPKYRLEVLPSNQVNRNELGSFQLIIAKIKFIEGEIILDKKFIPPCSNLNCYSVLMTEFEHSASTFQSIYNMALKVLRKIQDKNKPSNIAKNLKLMCESILGYYSQYYFKIRNVIPQQSPIFYIEAYSILANTYQEVLHLITSDEREELIKYKYEWCDITPGDFENILTSAVKIRYDHYAILDAVENVQRFLNTLLIILTRIESLEFVGQKKENMVVTKEVVVQQIEQPKKRWSILD